MKKKVILTKEDKAGIIYEKTKMKSHGEDIVFVLKIGDNIYTFNHIGEIVNKKEREPEYQSEQ